MDVPACLTQALAGLYRVGSRVISWAECVVLCTITIAMTVKSVSKVGRWGIECEMGPDDMRFDSRLVFLHRHETPGKSMFQAGSQVWSTPVTGACAKWPPIITPNLF